MGIPVLIIGGSGSGKSTALRNLNPDDVLHIRSVKKSLPFSSRNWKPLNKSNPKGSYIQTDNYATIHKALDRALEIGKKIIVIDDSNYLMQNEAMRRVNETGYSKFTAMAKAYWDLLIHAQDLGSDIRVYFMCHSQADSEGIQKPKTIGKMLDDQVCIEGLFTIVLGANYNVEEERYYFSTRKREDVVKTPLGMFEESEIDNCLKLVDETICEYEGIE
ncbi:hypothetical protein VME_45890 [Vibrio harveyi 1DA3]|nr:hypothetical protein VME_45890 [Vibrio harveyi 1DA3]